MTPDKIVEDLLFRFQFGNGIVLKSEAIQAIKQYAREMCDKQKESCIGNWNEFESGNDIRDYNAIKNAPYPKELL